MTDWLEEAAEYEDRLIRLRRDLHACPELSDEEFRTTELLKKVLGDMGLEIQTPLETGLTALLRGGKPGVTVALRSDIDALPIREETGLAYTSKNPGIMHACGHDIHMSALVGCAQLLKNHQDELCGNVLFLLQPAEEGEGGAQRLIKAGVLKDVSAVFGAHVDPKLKAGTVGIRYGAFYAAGIKLDIIVHGRSCHGAEPEKGIDALDAAARLCVRLKELTDAETVISIGHMEAGTVRNIIADTAVINGICRVMNIKNREKVRNRVFEVIAEIEKETGASVETDIEFGYPGVDNHMTETALAEKCAAETFGAENMILLDKGTMTTEDFGYYLLEKPGCFYHVGCESEAPLHSPNFCPNEDAILCGAAMHAAVITAYMNEHKEGNR